MRRKITLAALLFSILIKNNFSQTYPVFGKEIPVTINGLTFDAMEPSISTDGNYLFFNSINDGNTTSLYYAERVNDSTFTYKGALKGADQTITPRLDAVASSDSANNFYWVSTRGYPTQIENYHYGKFTGTDVADIGRLHGNFYINTPGWIIMDAAINYTGSLLYYCNAYFNNCTGVPCQAKLGIAQKQNDSTFNKLGNSDGILKNINNSSYLVYAPFITKNELELYFTRILVSNPTQTYICLSVRSSPSDTFSLPSVISISGQTPEAPTLLPDKSRMYYHKKSGTLFKIFMRYRTVPTGIKEAKESNDLKVFPNPTAGLITISSEKIVQVEVYNCFGQLLKKVQSEMVDISDLQNGIYILRLTNEGESELKKIILSKE